MSTFTTFDAPIGGAGTGQGAGGRRADASDIGSSEGFQVAADALQTYSKDLTARHERDELASVRQLMVEGGFEWDKTVQERANNIEEGAEGFTTGVKTDLAQWVEDGREQFTTDAARQLYDMKAAQLTGSVISSSSTFEATEHARFTVAKVTKTVDIINNRVTTNPSYYESGDAKRDILDQVEDLRARKLPEPAVAAQQEVWLTQLEVTAVNGLIDNATTSDLANDLVDDLASDESEWKDKLTPAAYAQAVELSWKNLENVLVKEEREINDALKDTQAANAMAATRAIVEMTGPPSDAQVNARVEGERLRQDFLKNPDNWGAKAGRSLDIVLDRLDAADIGTPDDKQGERDWAVRESDIDLASQRPDLTEEDAVKLRGHLDDGRDAWQETGTGIKPAKYTTIAARLNKAVIESREHKAQVTHINGVISGAIPATMDPNDTDDMKTVDVGYEAMNSGWVVAEQDDKGSRQANVVAFVGKVKIVPNALQSEIMGQLNSGDPDQVIKAEGLMKQLESSGVLIPAQLGNNAQASFGRQVFSYNELGMEPRAAFDRATELRKVSEADQNARATAMRGKEGIFESSNLAGVLSDAVDDDIIGTGGDEDAIPPVLRDEYRRLVELEYQIMGDPTAAANSAIATLRGTWGTHYQGGTAELMKKPPALYYNFGPRGGQDTSEAMMNQLYTDITTGGMIEGELDASRVILQYNPHNEHNGSPTYSVILLPDSERAGMTVPQQIGGADFYWYPDYATSYVKEVDAADLEAAKDAVREDARSQASQVEISP